MHASVGTVAARDDAPADVAAALVEREPALARERLDALEHVERRQRPDPPELASRVHGQERPRGARRARGRPARVRGSSRRAPERPPRRAPPPHARGGVARAPSTLERAHVHARRRRWPHGRPRRRVAAPRIRHSAERATARATRSGRRRGERAASASSGSPRTAARPGMSQIAQRSGRTMSSTRTRRR